MFYLAQCQFNIGNRLKGPTAARMLGLNYDLVDTADGGFVRGFRDPMVCFLSFIFCHDSLFLSFAERFHPKQICLTFSLSMYVYMH